MKVTVKDKAQIVLNELHKDAKNDFLQVGKGFIKSLFRPIKPSDFKDAYLPISKAQGKILRTLIIENNCKNIVEFGTSFGISTIYLAHGARDIGGKVISTEIIQSKALRAIRNIEKAGLSDYVNIRIGDAMKTLENISEPIDFLFLDGWKDLYLPLFKMLEPLFHTNTLIYADNINMAGAQKYHNYVSKKTSIYKSEILSEGKAMLTVTVAQKISSLA